MENMELYSSERFYGSISELKDWVYAHVFKDGILRCGALGESFDSDSSDLFDTMTDVIELVYSIQYEYERLASDNASLRGALKDALAKMADTDKMVKKK